jgi:class 3 adenylate cyclase
MRTCRRCGEENPENARFCLHCGEPLAEPDQRRVERKFATVLFADIVGSTSLAEREDAEVVQAVVGRAFDRLSEEIARHEGLLEKFMGDAVLAIFGVPRTHEDDPERAVRAAFEMQAVLSELNRSFADEGMPELQMRIGIESGEILVDQDRASGPRDRMITGDAVNVAARLEASAEFGRVIVGPGVYEATKDVIEYRELAPLELKGKREPVPAWQVLRIRAQQRGERPQLGMQAALVGRDEELTVLRETFRRVEGEGRPALVTVIGPAGVGWKVSSKACPSSPTGDAVAVWRTGTRRTQRSPTRSKRSARSWKTTPTRRPSKRSRRRSPSCSATMRSRRRCGPSSAPATPWPSRATICSTRGVGSWNGWRLASR